MLPSLIHGDQTDYIKGPFIGQNVRLIADIIECTDSLDISGIALFLDFKKAFDSLEWNFILKAFKTFGFGPPLIQWVKTFYNNIQSCVINNGYATPFFELQLGVRQGCPLSGILFVIAVEILANSMRDDQSIMGITIKGKEYKLSQYADDTSCFARDIDSVVKLFEKLEAFKSCSGLELNRSKTEAMWLGKNNPQPQTFSALTGPRNVCLGVCFSRDSKISVKDNFEKRLLALEKCLNIWSSRDLTLYGKIAIVKNLALSKIVFIASVLSAPSGFVDQVSKLLSSFIWNHKPPKIKHSTMIGKIKNGGLNMPNFKIINKSLKAGWVKRFLNPQTQSWKKIPFDLLHHVGGPLLFECNFSIKTLPEFPFLPLFYRDVLNAWEEIIMHTPTTKEEIENEILWNNHLVTIGGKSIFYRQWFNAGVKTLSDILDEEEKFLSFPEFWKKYKIKTNFLRYLGLCNAIPKYWKEALNREENEPVNIGQSATHPLNISFWTCKQARSFYVSKTFQNPTSKARLIKAGFTDRGIEALYILPFKVTKT